MKCRNKTFLFIVFFLAFLRFLQIAPASAQTVTTGAIAGTVTDPSNSSIAGVQITATDKGTGAKRSVATDASGTYRFNLLPPGHYQLEFTATGFKKAVPNPNQRKQNYRSESGDYTERSDVPKDADHSGVWAIQYRWKF